MLRNAGRGRNLVTQMGGVVARFSVTVLAAAAIQNTSAASAREHWAFQPVGDPAEPAVKQSDWPRNSVDFFTLNRLEEAGLKPLRPAEKRALIRRATYDLTGLPPTYSEVEAFVADNSPEAFDQVVKRLLASPAYGENWGRHWLDVVRYADTAGETADYPVPVAWRYRNYVIDSFNADKPYDQFIREQMAGDILAREGDAAHYAERVTATGFIALSRRFGFDSENYHHLTIQDTLDTLGQSVLGLSIGCARCHDHKYDPIPARDYYALYGIFQSTRYAFPGSEQKQRMRALVPLVPRDESERKWDEFNARVALLRGRLERSGQSAPSALLRSLDEMDGDFEGQAPAAGGSRGVLVPPWFYAGDISATGEAQSPFKNVNASGRVGVAMLTGTNVVSKFYQALHPARSREDSGKVYFNVDYKLAAGEQETGERHLWIGSHQADGDQSPVLVLSFSKRGVLWQTATSSGAAWEPIGSLAAGEWQNLQAEIDLESGQVTGTIGGLTDRTSFRKPLLTSWTGPLDFISAETVLEGGETAPALSLDNIGIRMHPFPPPAKTPVGDAGSEFAVLRESLQRLVGMDGDLEFQTEGEQPAEPWAPGPNSKVRLSSRAQSPYANIYPLGGLGILMDAGARYDGFMQKLARSWKAADSNALYASFDFRCGPETGNPGAWRFYLGHGAGSSAAIELHITGDAVSAKSGETWSKLAGLEPGRWYQVQLRLDLSRRDYTGAISTADNTTDFSGKLADGWDGNIDHVFIDSYGNPGGARRELHADNFALSESAFPSLAVPAVTLGSAELARRREEREELRERISKARRQLDEDRKELENLLNAGPFEMAYGVVEGTPEDARVQLRGEPEKLGPTVARGFLSCLPFASERSHFQGSGRLELADWLVDRGNPLTARVMVNRIWKHHFGRGLVETPNDFGLRGQRPTHPELLDHLAGVFIKRGWSIKEMHRLIMLSATYQQTTADGDLKARELYQGVERRRLTAEELRDSILFVSGKLDGERGSIHAFPAAFTWGYSQHSPFNAVYEHNRRSVYLMQQRIRRHPFLALFDGADPNTSVPERRTTTVPTQSLFFLNDPMVHQSSEHLARLLLQESSAAEAIVHLAWHRVLGRAPSEAEQADALQFLEEYESRLGSSGEAARGKAIAALARTLVGSNEFLHVD